MDPNAAKTYGGIGAILIFISPIVWILLPLGEYLGLLVALIGVVCELMAMNVIAKAFSDRGIIRNSLLGILLQVAGIAAMLIAALVSFSVFSSALANLGININNPSDVSRILNDPNFFVEHMDILTSYAGAVIVGYILLVSLLIVGSYFLRKSLIAVSARTKVGLFGTSSFAMLLGAFLSIIAIGLVVVWVAWLVIAIAFFTIKPGWAEASSGAYAPAQPSVSLPLPPPPSPP